MLDCVREAIGEFRQDMLNSFGERLECLVLAGSHARGDARPDSDIDIWVFLDQVLPRDLERVGNLLAKRPASPEINPQCTTFREAASDALREGFSPMQLHFDGEILHGDLRLPAPSADCVRSQSAAIASFVVMSCRHYIVVRESTETLMKGKLRNWVLKPLMWAMRYDVFARTGRYPKTLEQLSESVESERSRELVGVFRELLKYEFRGDCYERLRQSHQVACELMLRKLSEPADLAISNDHV